MALTKDQKKSVVSDVEALLNDTKMTVVAKYQGLDVKMLQQLRKNAKENGTTVKIIKNRLFNQAIKKNDKLKKVDTGFIEGMLLYGFNNQDEIGAAQVINRFSKTNQALTFVGAINESGEFIDADTLKTMANLPSKNELLAGVIIILNSPISKVNNIITGGLSNILKSLEAVK